MINVTIFYFLPILPILFTPQRFNPIFLTPFFLLKIQLFVFTINFDKGLAVFDL